MPLFSSCMAKITPEKQSHFLEDLPLSRRRGGTRGTGRAVGFPRPASLLFPMPRPHAFRHDPDRPSGRESHVRPGGGRLRRLWLRLYGFRRWAVLTQKPWSSRVDG